MVMCMVSIGSSTLTDGFEHGQGNVSHRLKRPALFAPEPTLRASEGIIPQPPASRHAFWRSPRLLRWTSTGFPRKIWGVQEGRVVAGVHPCKTGPREGEN